MKKFVICLVFVVLFVGFANAQTKSVTGTVVYYTSGASGNFEIIEVQVGNRKYEVYLFRKDLPSPKIVGTVNEVGRVVRIYYSKIVGGELRATRVVEVRKARKK
jgi:hypothetical protein